jgi:hypothetical protein
MINKIFRKMFISYNINIYMSSHKNCKKLNELLKIAKNNNFILVHTDKCIKLYPPKNINVQYYTVHYAEKAYHPLRRYIEKDCNIEI